MHTKLFCADIGTSSLKAAVIADDGTVLNYVRLPFPRPVKAADWVHAFFSAWRTLSAHYAVDALCISGNGPSLIAVPHKSGMAAAGLSGAQAAVCSVTTGTCDAVQGECQSGQPKIGRYLSDSAINGMIERAEKAVLFLWNEPLPPDFTVLQSPSLFLPRIAAFRAIYPQAFDTAAQIFSGPEYLLYLLTGQAVTVLPDPRYEAAYWNKEELSRFAESVLRIDEGKLAGLLPPFVTAGEAIGYFCGIPVIAGVPDFIAALIGTGTLIAGAACDRAGSSEGLNVCIPQPRHTEGALLLPSVIPDLWNSSFVIPSSGAAFSAFLISHGLSGNNYGAAMERIAAEPFMPAGAYPTTFAGQGRSFVERLAFRIRRGCDILEQGSGMRPVYTLSGGQAHNPCWCQMKADMTGRTFALPHFADAELLGDAALALYGLGRRAALPAIAKTLIRIERYYEPNPLYAARYAEKYASHVIS